jgi:hypothetical protein
MYKKTNSFLLCMDIQPYSHDCFSKNIKNFVWFPKQYLLGFFILEKYFGQGFPVSPYNTLLLYSLSPYSRTELETEKHTCCAWAGGTFFQLCCCVSFWFWWEIHFVLHTYVLRVLYSCGVVSVFLVLAGNSFWYVHSPYSCGVVLVFWFWQEIVFGVTCVLSVQYSCVVVFLKNDYSVFLF